MRDEIDGRMWAEHHEAFTKTITEFFAATRAAMHRLHAIQWDAPWRRDRELRRVAGPGQA